MCCLFLDFETELSEKFATLYAKDMEMLSLFAKTKTKNPLSESKAKLEPWDIRYYIRELTELYVLVPQTLFFLS
jgi:Zn-dependent oligopeptidase